MLQIGKLYKTHTDGQCRLCADITLNGKGATLWFGVEEEQESYLCADRSDAFVMAMLPAAMRGGYEIVCQTPMSERLHYQLLNYLVPTLCDAGDLYHPIRITAPLTAERVPNMGGVGTGFSGGVDCLYTVMSHGTGSEYPLTHLTLFNVGVFDGPAYRQAFRHSCHNARQFAEEMEMELVCLDSNICEVLPERYLDVVSYRLLAGVLALQNLFSVYLLSSTYDTSVLYFDLHGCYSHETLILHCAQTESLAIYSAGSGVKRIQKTTALAGWKPAHRWLHPCVYGHVGEKNCGHCKKCIREQSVYYALGVLDDFDAVFDVAAFKKALPQRLGFLIANRHVHMYDDAMELVESSGVKIPPIAYTFAEQFRKAMKNLEGKQP